jgi:hypothetical protein
MISVKSLLKSKLGRKLPAKIRKHKAFQTISHIEKIFPYIGLENSSERFKSKIESLELDNTRICFSSDKNSGAWDIATMSMRGIHSCMKWSSKQSKHLNGSILDPFTAVIYITDGKKLKYGSRILRRSVVRYMVYKNGSEYKPFIFLERVYRCGAICSPIEGRYVNEDPNEKYILSIFKTYIRDRISVDIPIWCLQSMITTMCAPIGAAFMIQNSYPTMLKEDEHSYSDAKFSQICLSSEVRKKIFPQKFLEIYNDL